MTDRDDLGHDTTAPTLRRVRRWVADHVMEAGLIALLLAGGTIGLAWLEDISGGDDGGESEDQTQMAVTEIASGTSPAEPSVPEGSATTARCEDPIGGGEVEWVQVESSTVRPDEWLTPSVAQSADLGLEFCEGDSHGSATATLMLARPFTTKDIERLDDASPPAQLGDVCNLRRAMRITGGELPYRAPGMSAYFSDFQLQPSSDWIGPNRCFALLAGDPEYGSRAALDRYFGILDVQNGKPEDVSTVEPMLAEVTTDAFRERSGGTEPILDAWSDCNRVQVLYLSAPQQMKGLEHIEAHVECVQFDGAARVHDLVLAMSPPDGSGSVWKLHWDPANWGPAPAG